MKFDVTEISSLIKQEILRYQSQLEVSQVGTVLEVGDGIARLYGLENAMVGEMLEFEGGIIGEVFNLDEDSIGAVIYGDFTRVRESGTVRSTGKLLSVPVGPQLLGRVVNALCEPLDGLGEIRAESRRFVEFKAPGIAQRQPVKEPLTTGIKSIDSMIPIGRGQRELIIGDRKTGKTAIALDTIINQKGKGVVCVYVAIGQKESTVAEVVTILKKHGAMDHTVVVLATAAESAAMQYIAPYTGAAIAEYFMYDKNGHTLCVYDDLSKHAIAYRELSLLLRRPPGREAFPGDIFYLHSRLLERSVKLSDALGGGSMTALPIVETLEGQVSAYIPTNIISITDGQIYLQRELFLAGVRPAVDVGISVSRVGGAAQPQAMKKVAPKLRLDLASFRELQDFARLGTDLDEAAQKQLDRGYRMVEVLKQKQYSPMSVAEEVISILAGSSGSLDDIEAARVNHFLEEFLLWLRLEASEYLDLLGKTGQLDDDFMSALNDAVGAYKTMYKFSFWRIGGLSYGPYPTNPAAKKAASNICKVTGTMETIAAVRYRQYYNQWVAGIEYFDALSQLAYLMITAEQTISHPMMKTNTSKTNAVVAIGSNRGLCGAYNSEVFRQIETHLKMSQRFGRELKIYAKGRKITNYLEHRKIPTAGVYTDFDEIPSADQINKIADYFIKEYLAGRLDRLGVIYNRFHSQTAQRVQTLTLLPITDLIDDLTTRATVIWPWELTFEDFLFSEKPEELFETLGAMIIRSALAGCFLEAATSEYLARVVSMRNANDNAEEMIEELTKDYNRARQGQITTELLDIITGVSAAN